MNRTLFRLKILFLVLFLIGTAGSIVYHLMWVMPSRECAARNGWWAPRSRVCATPLDIRNMPRVLPPPAAAAASAPATPALPAQP